MGTAKYTCMPYVHQHGLMTSACRHISACMELENPRCKHATVSTKQRTENNMCSVPGHWFPATKADNCTQIVLALCCHYKRNQGTLAQITPWTCSATINGSTHVPRHLASQNDGWLTSTGMFLAVLIPPLVLSHPLLQDHLRLSHFGNQPLAPGFASPPIQQRFSACLSISPPALNCQLV